MSVPISQLMQDCEPCLLHHLKKAPTHLWVAANSAFKRTSVRLTREEDSESRGNGTLGRTTAPTIRGRTANARARAQNEGIMLRKAWSEGWSATQRQPCRYIYRTLRGVARVKSRREYSKDLVCPRSKQHKLLGTNWRRIDRQSQYHRGNQNG